MLCSFLSISQDLEPIFLIYNNKIMQAHLANAPKCGINYNDDEIVLPLNIYEVLFCLRVLSLENKLFLNSFDRGLYRFGSIVHHFASSSSSCFAYLNGIFNQLVILWLGCTYIRIKRQHFSKKWNNKYTNTSSAQILRVVRSDAYQLFVLVLMVFLASIESEK